ncbi:hypothetical protein ACIA5G_39805 [Amycolatopsis sp. NPDC051758]|uniref:hypothetical protein n=1 Tax=Amycolatopsis sp. NPDC051758 TaxID=3363935 RepID=UPI003788D77A
MTVHISFPHHTEGPRDREPALARGLALPTDRRASELSPAAAVTQMLADPRWLHPKPDIAAEVLRVEAELRALERRLTAKVDQAARALATQRERLRTPRAAWFARGKAAHAALQAAADVHARTTAMRTEVVTYQELLRSFVIALAPHERLLAEAAAGWSRSSAVPAEVSVFRDAAYFLADSRRAAGSGRGPDAIEGRAFGTRWRRDDDDPVDQPLARRGCWTVGHIGATQEIYAVRRSHEQTAEVWLLGRGFTAPQARELLQPLITRMQEPNSLILAAAAIAHRSRDGDPRSLR